MFTIRYLNEGINLKREELFVEFLDRKYANFKFNSLEDYDALKLVNMSKSITQSKYIRKNLIDNIIGKSNGESAYEYFTSRIEGDGLFILDEPENSLSPKKQIELKFFIEESVKYFNCQFIISTHSPFLLSINQAKIYNLDSKPAKVEHWTDLENVKIYTEFFKNL
jgi:predicted ATPase